MDLLRSFSQLGTSISSEGFASILVAAFSLRGHSQLTPPLGRGHEGLLAPVYLFQADQYGLKARFWLASWRRAASRKLNGKSGVVWLGSWSRAVARHTIPRAGRHQPCWGAPSLKAEGSGGGQRG